MRPDVRRSGVPGALLAATVLGACGGDDAGVAADATPIDTCSPSAELVARIDPSRMLGDLEALTGLGERRSHAKQTAAAAHLRSELDELPGLVVAEHQYQRNGATYVNLEATLAGGDRADQYVLIGAHYDSTSENPSLAPGADDNASGTAAVLELARVMSGCTPARNVRFLFFSNEEVGTVGSERYVADRMAATPPSSVAGYLNVDMIAYGADTEDLNVAGREADRAFVETIATAMETWADKDVRRFIDDQCG